MLRSLPRAPQSSSCLLPRTVRSNPRFIIPASPCHHNLQPQQSRAVHAHAISNPTLAGIEKRWENMPPQEQADLWMALRDRMKVDWHELTLQERKAGTPLSRYVHPALPTTSLTSELETVVSVLLRVYVVLYVIKGANVNIDMSLSILDCLRTPRATRQATTRRELDSIQIYYDWRRHLFRSLPPGPNTSTRTARNYE